MEHPNTEGTISPAASALQDAARDPKGAADQAARQVGDTLKSAAEHVCERMPDSGIVDQVADAVSGGIKQAVTPLQEQGFGGMIDDVVQSPVGIPCRPSSWDLAAATSCLVFDATDNL